MNAWRDTYTYRTPELIEYLRAMRTGTFTSTSGWGLKREIYIQSQEKGLIKLPEDIPINDAHIIPFSKVTILNEEINKDSEVR
jgi:hypothetical protein